jgi:hypothetical protein
MCLIVHVFCLQEKEVLKREKATSKDATAAAKQVNEVSKRSVELNALEAGVGLLCLLAVYSCVF